MLFVLLVFVAVTLIAWLLTIPQKSLSPTTRSAFVLGAMMGNTGNFGLPFVAFAFSQYGEQAVQISIIVFVTATLINQTLGIYIASSGTASVIQGIRNVLTVPVPYAAALGLAFNLAHINLPLPLNRALDLMAGAAMPLMLVLLGVQLSRISLQGHLRQLVPALSLSAALRLIVGPAICIGIALLMNFGGLPRNIALVQLSMPTAVTAALLATEFGSDVQFVSATILITTIASLLTLSLIMTIFVF
jgi:predicted permease